MRDNCTSIADKVILVFFYFLLKHKSFGFMTLLQCEKKVIIIGTKMIVAHARVE